jgi:hypothetical protein
MDGDPAEQRARIRCTLNGGANKIACHFRFEKAEPGNRPLNRRNSVRLPKLPLGSRPPLLSKPNIVLPPKLPPDGRSLNRRYNTGCRGGR